MDGNDRDLMQSFEAASKRIVRVDVEYYQDMLDGSGLSDLQKQQVIEALWNMMVAFTDLGFRIEPLEESCGKPSDPSLQDAFKDSDAIESVDHEKD